MVSKERCLSPWKWSFFAVIIYIFCFLTISTVAKAIVRAFEIYHEGIIALFIALTVGVIALIPLTFLDNAIKKRGCKKEETS